MQAMRSLSGSRAVLRSTKAFKGCVTPLRSRLTAMPRASSLSSSATVTAVLPITSVRSVSTFRRLWDNDWITEEAEQLIGKAYKRHRALGDSNTQMNPRPTKAELETLGADNHYPPQNFRDRTALKMVRMLTPLTHLFFRERYNHHAVVLETVAAVPGMVGGMFRHLRSLRNMRRDYGWIYPLLEDAENERMHLLTWMQITQPSLFEKLLVMAAQGFYFGAYSVVYLLSPTTAHRFVAYLEEEAVRAYTAYLAAIDAGKLPNFPAPAIAKKYWGLEDDATIRDVVLFVRADECMHRNFNHRLADLTKQKRYDEPPNYPPTEGEEPKRST